MPTPQTEHQPNTAENETIAASPQESILKAVMALSDAGKPPRAVKRPDFSPKKGLCKLVVALLLFTGLGFALHRFAISLLWLLLAAFIVLCCCSKGIVKWLVLLYQRYAPEKVRASCLFTPSCSEYMLIAIDKYGLCKGLYKGTHRLCRCHYPNGGEDNP